MADPIPAEAVDTEELADVAALVPVRSSTVLHQGKIWDVVAEDFEYGDAVLTREYVDHPGAVAVLALDDENRVLMIRQYRHPIRMRDWELPAGLLDVDGEEPLEAAKRELIEEADLEATSWSRLAEFYTSPGGSNELLRVYLARGLTATDAFARFAEEEHIEVRWVELEDAVDAVLAGRLKNSILTIAVLTAHARRG